MTKEEFIISLIKNNGYNLKSFAEITRIPYSTLTSMLKAKKLGGASVNNVIKICKELNITVEDIYNETNDDIIKSEHSLKEAKLIQAYRAKPEMQPAVDRILGIEK